MRPSSPPLGTIMAHVSAIWGRWGLSYLPNEYMGVGLNQWRDPDYSLKHDMGPVL